MYIGCYFTDVTAQNWRSLNGPSESDISDIVIKNDTIYTASSGTGGFFKRGIHSSQWFYASVSEGEGAFRKGIAGPLSIDVDSQGNYYVGGAGEVNLGDQQSYNQFFVSNNYGNSWSEFRNGIEYHHTIMDIFVTEEGNVLLGSAGGLLSYNMEEQKFEKVGITDWGYTFFQHKDTLLAGTIDGIEFSVDEGDTWIETGPDSLSVFSISHLEENYLLGTYQGLYRTNNLNSAWTFIESFSSEQINSLYSYQDVTIAGTDAGTVTISPSGWEVAPVFPMLDGLTINAIQGYEDSLYIGTNQGLYNCNLVQNSCIRDGVPNAIVRNLTFHNTDTLLTGTSKNIYRYFITAGIWDSLTVPVERTNAIVPLNSDSLLAISGSFLYRCSFINVECDSEQVDSGNSLFDLKQNSTGDLFLTSSRRVLQSKNNEENWEEIYNNPDNNNRNIFTFSDSLLFINTESGLIKYFLDQQTYEPIGFEESGLKDYYITDNGTIYGSAYYSIHKSTDFGESWTRILLDSDVTGSDILTNLVYDEYQEKLYAITFEGRIYVTGNEGQNWGIHEEMYTVYINSAAIGPNGILYLGTDEAGVFTNTQPLNPPITISNEEVPNTSVPKSFKLQQNYPNPFNPSTTVPFELNQAAEVSISLYNVFGQKVREYNIGRKSAGVHQHQIDMNRQASGVYFLKVRAGEHSEVIKISFIK